MTPECLGSDMEGICRQDGMVVFVPGLLPGETADVRIVKAEARYAYGKIVRTISNPSSIRKDPDCSSYPRCGGCTCRHMTYETTLEAKRQQVVDCFARIGHLTVDVPPVIGMTNPTRYRNKTSLPVGLTPNGSSLGFFAFRSHNIVPVNDCPNAMAPTSQICHEFTGWMKEFEIQPYNEARHDGLIRHLMIRVNRDGQSMVIPVINDKKLPHTRELTERLAPLGMVGLVVNHNTARTNVILGNRFTTLYGKDTLHESLCGLDFEISAPSFFQVNPIQTEHLYQTAINFASLTGSEKVCDVYCGAGTISLTMAAHCDRVIGIEIVPEAIENAKRNAARNHINNCTFMVGDAEKTLPELVNEGLRPDVIVVDPPRKGLVPAVIHALADADPSRIVYVSCNVATQARDAAILAELGYHVDRVQPVDMFCWTSGVENVILLSK